MQTQTQNYRQLTQGQRYPIQALCQNGFFLRRIAEDIGCHARSVCRELKRNQHQFALKTGTTRARCQHADALSLDRAG